MKVFKNKLKIWFECYCWSIGTNWIQNVEVFFKKIISFNSFSTACTTTLRSSPVPTRFCLGLFHHEVLSFFMTVVYSFFNQSWVISTSLSLPSAVFYYELHREIHNIEVVVLKQFKNITETQKRFKLDSVQRNNDNKKINLMPHSMFLAISKLMKLLESSKQLCLRLLTDCFKSSPGFQNTSRFSVPVWQAKRAKVYYSPTTFKTKNIYLLKYFSKGFRIKNDMRQRLKEEAKISATDSGVEKIPLKCGNSVSCNVTIWDVTKVK